MLGPHWKVFGGRECYDLFLTSLSRKWWWLFNGFLSFKIVMFKDFLSPNIAILCVWSGNELENWTNTDNIWEAWPSLKMLKFSCLMFIVYYVHNFMMHFTVLLCILASLLKYFPNLLQTFYLAIVILHNFFNLSGLLLSEKPEL